jgi:major type 1 subunit fimbrin (pilin)
MNIRIKRAMAVAGIATAMALPLSSQASDGTITFTGAITANTCVVNVNGSGLASTTVALPVVSQSALLTGAGKTTAAGTFFNVAITSCTATTVDIPGTPVHAPTTVQIYFEAGPNVDQATGGLINATTAGNSNVEVNLYNASSNVVGTQIMPGVATNQPTAQTLTALGTQWFYAGYSTAGFGIAATAGPVSTSVTYSLVYQ